MPGACLMADVSSAYSFVSETCCKGFGIAQVSPSIIAHINDESAAQGKGMQAFVKITFANAGRERRDVDLADVVWKDGVAQS